MAAVQSPVGNFIFTLKLGGAEKAAWFAEVSGLSTENQVVEHTAAAANGKPLPQRFAGQVKWSNIVLKRGVDAAQDLWKWRQQILNGEIDKARQSVVITVMDQTGKEAAAYSVIRAWPCKYSSPGLNSGGNEILVEEMELAHEGFTRTK